MNIKSHTALKDITPRDWAQFGAGEVARAQRLLSRMLDTGVAPNELHFDALLRACARAQWIKRSDRWNDHLKAAAAVPPSMVELGLEVSESARNSGAILRNYLTRRPCLHR